MRNRQFVTILRPGYERNRTGGPPKLSDYVAVPRTALHGEYRIKAILKPEHLHLLTKLAREMDRKRS